MLAEEEVEEGGGTFGFTRGTREGGADIGPVVAASH